MTKPVVPGLTGHIATVGDGRLGASCQRLFVMNADGTGVRAVTEPGVAYFYAELSPDGSRIGFEGACGPSGKIALCVINVDGTDLQMVLAGDVNGFAWSPDGQRIAYERSAGPYKWEIYTARPDGSDEKQVTRDGAQANQATWSPDGRSIAYVSDKDGTYQIFRVGVDGGVPVLLAKGGDVNQAPAWSHDGRRIAFSSNRSGKPDSPYLADMRKTPGNGGLPQAGAADIYVMDADGSNVVRLTSDTSANRGPSWSPDDRHLVFTTDREKQYEAYVMAADGSDPRRVSSLRGGSEFASWSG